MSLDRVHIYHDVIIKVYTRDEYKIYQSYTRDLKPLMFYNEKLKDLDFYQELKINFVNLLLKDSRQMLKDIEYDNRTKNKKLNRIKRDKN